MRNYFFSFTTILFLFLSANYSGEDQLDHEAITADETVDLPIEIEEMSKAMDDLTFVIDEAAMGCSMTFSSSQDYSCCNTDTDGCACVNMTVLGLYTYGCGNNVTDIWFESMFLCSQGPWSGVSPTIQIELDLFAAFSGSSTVYVPVTMKWTYNCGFGTCQGSYSKNVRMLIC